MKEIKRERVEASETKKERTRAKEIEAERWWVGGRQ